MTVPCPTFGFLVAMDLATELDPSGRALLRDAWLALLRSRGLDVRGGGVERLAYLVTSEASQATESDRRAIGTWLATRPELRGWQVGDLEDLGSDG